MPALRESAGTHRPSPARSEVSTVGPGHGASSAQAPPARSSVLMFCQSSAGTKRERWPTFRRCDQHIPRFDRQGLAGEDHIPISLSIPFTFWARSSSRRTS